MIEKQFPTRSEWKKHLHTHPLKAHGIWARMKEYVPGWGYSQAEIDAFFEGETGGGKKQVHWDSLTGKPATFTPSVHAVEHDADGGDPLSNPLLLGAFPVINWQSDPLLLKTDEGVNTNTDVRIQGKGTGVGILRLYDADNAERIEFSCQSGIGYIKTDGVSPNDLYLQDTAHANVRCFSNAGAGENRYFYIFGWKTGVGTKYGGLVVEASGNFVIYTSAGQGLALKPGGTLVAFLEATQMRIYDNIPVGFGDSLDYSAGYHLATDSLQIVDGSTLNANIRAKLNASGQWFFSGSAFYIDSTWLTAHNKVKDSDKVDGEHASAIVTNARVKVHFPDTIANILSNHTLAVHNALDITELGTVSSGIWQGTAIANAYVAGIDQNLLQASSPTFAGGTFNGLVAIKSQNELRFYDNGNYVGFEAPALVANQIWVLPTADADADKDVLVSNSGGVLSWYRPNIDWLSDVDIDGWITPYMNCLLAYNQDTGKWAAAIPEYDIRWKSYDITWEFWDATPPSPWAYGILNGGTVTISNTANHPGWCTIKTRFDGDASSSGYYFVASNNKLSINGLEQMDFVFRTHTPLTGVRFRMGFLDSLGTAVPNDGIYFEVAADGALRGVTIKGGAFEYTGTTYALAVNTWYRGRIIVPSDPVATGITFTLYNEAGAQLWQQSNLTAAKIPTGTDYVGFGVVAWLNFDDNLQSVISIDLAELICARGLTR